MLERVVGVLDGVVQEGRRDRARSDPEVGEDLRDRHRVADVRLAALALLPGVGLLGGRVRALDQRHIRLGVMGAHRLQQTGRPRRPAARAEKMRGRSVRSEVALVVVSVTPAPPATKCRRPSRSCWSAHGWRPQRAGAGRRTRPT